MFQRVHQPPETPALDPETATRLSGHVWVQELPTGGDFRFRVAESGLVTFGTPEGTFDGVASVPVPYRRAAQAIDDRLDREALRAATDDPSAVTFCGVATWHRGVDYDWESLPAFVGVDVRSGSKGTFLSPDAATGALERLGLSTLPAIDKELSAAHADFARYEAPEGFPQSAWRDGRAAGVLIRDKSGGRAEAWREGRAEPESTATDRSPEELAAAHATGERIDRTADELRAVDRAVTVETVTDRLVDDVAREAHAELYVDGEFVSSTSAFRSAVAERVHRRLSGSG